MNTSYQTTNRFLFFGIMSSGQAYINLLYVLAAFPLGLFYFVYLVFGISLGISLSIIWIGVPLLLLVGAGWWMMASFERYMAIHLLKENVPEMALPTNKNNDRWTDFKAYFTNPVTWKSLLYLFIKGPLGLASFVVLAVLVSLTFGLLSMPFTYQHLEPFHISFGLVLPVWQIDSLADALLAALVGLILWPVTLHITNWFAGVHGKFAKVMLGNYPFDRFAAIIETEE
jgi:hypothetical protein